MHDSLMYSAVHNMEILNIRSGVQCVGSALHDIECMYTLWCAVHMESVHSACGVQSAAHGECKSPQDTSLIKARGAVHDFSV